MIIEIEEGIFFLNKPLFQKQILDLNNKKLELSLY